MSKPGRLRSEDAPDAEFSVHLKRENPLPLIPVDPKLLDYPFPADRHYKYEQCSLYRNAQQKMYLDEKSVTSQLSLLALKHAELLIASAGPVKRTLKTKQELVPEDHVLLTPFVKADEKVIGKTRTNVSWLRRTEYISSEGRVFGKAKAQKAKELSAEVLEDDSLESRIRAIEQSFVFANKTSLLSLKHPTNPSITAQEIFPVFPDFEFWPNQYTLASYDMDPMSKEFSRSGQTPEEEKTLHSIQQEEAVLKLVAQTKEQLSFGYFAPSRESAQKLIAMRQSAEELGEDEEFDETGDYDYRLIRNFNAKFGKSNFPIFIELRKEEGGAFYNELKTKFTLKKKRALARDQDEDEEMSERAATRIHLHKRPLTEDEVHARQEVRRDAQLL